MEGTCFNTSHMTHSNSQSNANDRTLIFDLNFERPAGVDEAMRHYVSTPVHACRRSTCPYALPTCCTVMLRVFERQRNH